MAAMTAMTVIPTSAIAAGSTAAESRSNTKILCMPRRSIVPRGSVVAMASDYRRDGGGGGGGVGDFVTGFLLGGAVFGALGFLLAPQVKRSVAEVVDREATSLPKRSTKFFEDDETGDGIEKTRKSLSDKISQLNEAIDTVSAQLRENEKVAA